MAILPKLKHDGTERLVELTKRSDSSVVLQPVPLSGARLVQKMDH
jgi:hypothetical protein